MPSVCRRYSHKLDQLSWTACRLQIILLCYQSPDQERHGQHPSRCRCNSALLPHHWILPPECAGRSSSSPSTDGYNWKISANLWPNKNRANKAFLIHRNLFYCSTRYYCLRVSFLLHAAFCFAKCHMLRQTNGLLGWLIVGHQKCLFNKLIKQCCQFM